MDTPNLQTDIETLSRHEAFGRFMAALNRFREEEIAELHDAPTEKIQQISGRIITYDQILRIANWEQLQNRFRERV